MSPQYIQLKKEYIDSKKTLSLVSVNLQSSWDHIWIKLTTMQCYELCVKIQIKGTIIYSTWWGRDRLCSRVDILVVFYMKTHYLQ